MVLVIMLTRHLSPACHPSNLSPSNEAAMDRLEKKVTGREAKADECDTIGCFDVKECVTVHVKVRQDP